MASNISYFDGSCHPRIFCHWLDSLVCFFNYCGLTDHEKVMFAKSKLAGKAMVWWLKAELDEIKMERIFYTWEEMREKLLDEFLPSYRRQKLLDEFYSLEQGSMSAEEYLLRFDELFYQAQVVQDPYLTIAQFKAGLRDDIRQALEGKRFYRIEDAFQAAVNAEFWLRISKFINGGVKSKGQKLTQAVSRPKNFGQQTLNAPNQVEKPKEQLEESFPLNIEQPENIEKLPKDLNEHDEEKRVVVLESYEEKPKVKTEEDFLVHNNIPENQLVEGVVSAQEVKYKMLDDFATSENPKEVLVETQVDQVPTKSPKIFALSIPTIDFVVGKFLNLQSKPSQIFLLQPKVKMKGSRDYFHDFSSYSLKKFQTFEFFILQFFKTRGRVFSNQGRMMQTTKGSRKYKFKDFHKFDQACTFMYKQPSLVELS